MVDIHCHILPGIDDGAADLYDSLSMASLAEKSGVKAIVATPHCNVPGSPSNYFDRHFREILIKTRKAFEAEGISVKLLGGMEVFATYDLPELIKEGKILTINQSRYLLVEFGFYEEPEFAQIMVRRLRELNVVPVIAHPERYEFIKEDLEFAKNLKAEGCVFQANKGSFLGRYGSSTEKCAFELINNRLIDVIASDAHNPDIRTPHMTGALEKLNGKYDAKSLFSTNPRLICTNKTLFN